MPKMIGRRLFAPAPMFVLFTSLFSAQEPRSPAVADVVSQAQKNVALFQDRLPDFVCDEHVTDRTIEKGKVTEESRILSSFRAIRNPHRGSASPFTESREVISASVNGKPVAMQNYELPIGVRGGFSDDLLNLFSKDSAQCYDFVLAGNEEIKGHTTFVVSISVKDNVAALGKACSSLRPGRTSKAWVDRESMQVVRLQKSPIGYWQFSTPFAKSNGDYSILPSIDYSAVLINGTQFWLPEAKRVEFIKVKGQRSYFYEVEYRNCHKFVVSSKIVPSAP